MFPGTVSEIGVQLAYWEVFSGPTLRKEGSRIRQRDVELRGSAVGLS